MNISDIIEQYQQLSAQLKHALSSMEKKDDVFRIRQQLTKLQNNCPHFTLEYNYPFINGCCPYCGKLVNKGDKDGN